MAGHVRNTKDRDMQALEVRAGTPVVGRTSRDAAGLSSTNSNRVKVARTSVENGPISLCSETEAEIWPLLLSQKRHSKPPGKATREQKPGNIPAHNVPIPIPPHRGQGDSTKTGLPEYQHGRPLP